jgi:hypothetical protein
MDLDSLIVTAFCAIDDALNACLAGKPLRCRGPRPLLADAEVLTVELVGEYLGLDQDAKIFSYFRRHYGHFFPALGHLHRTIFVRQASKLWQIKARLWQQLLGGLQCERTVSIIDSFPIAVCRFARARRCRRLRELSAYGHDEMIKQTFFGVRLHLRVFWPGVITCLEIAPANIHETAVAEELSVCVRGYALGDRNYGSRS